MVTDSPQRYPEERRLATVLFADVQGFTSLAEQLDFETVSDMIKDISKRLDKAIEAHNGYIDKHLGDGVMGVWGAPFAGDNDAEEAVAAGLDMIRALADFCAKTHIPGAENLKLRVGINSGLVFAGYVGTRNEYTMIGDTVNVASRLEQIADAGTVVIGENTLRLVRGSFRVHRLEPFRAKGKTEMMQPYAVEGRLTTPGRFRYQSADSLITNMVGRNEELEKLQAFYDQTFESGRAAMVLLSGDVGIGKSRLMMDFGNRIEEKSDRINILSTRGLSQAARIPFYLWRVLLRNRFGVRDEDPSQTANEKWHRGVESVWESGEEKTKFEATQLLGEMIGLSGESNFGTDERLQRIFFLMRELLKRISARKQLILFFDDLQWGDRESLQLLSNFLTSEENPFPMLVVGGARTEFLKNQPQWHNLSRVILLNPLTFDANMVASAYPDIRDLPEDILHEIAIRSEGNPYFLEEIVKSLLKAGLLEPGQDPKEIQKTLLSKIPESLLATLQARMDNLSREARTVALLASVIGRVFWVGALLKAARSEPLPGATPMITVPEMVVDRFIQDGLRQLVRAELAFPRSGSKFSDEQEYIFKNSYLRDVAYSLIPNRNRAQYHKAIAEWMKAKADPAYQTMAREHEHNAALAAKVSTGSLASARIPDK
ncbi:MAG: adenylate/guanylate cyclase domain-containing protein [Anaerolineales bacterium]